MPQNLRPLYKNPNTQPFELTTSGGPLVNSEAPQKTQPLEPVSMDKAVPNRVLRPNRTEYLENDLSEDDREKVIALMVSQARAALNEPSVTVNTVARMFGMEHNKVKRFCTLSTSLKTFLDSRDQSKNVSRLSHSISKLTPEERQLLLNQLTQTSSATLR